MTINSTTSELENLAKTFSVLVAPIKGMSEKLQLAEMNLQSPVVTQTFSGAFDSSSAIADKLKGIGKLPDPLSDQLKAVTNSLTNLFESFNLVAPHTSSGYIPSGVNHSFSPQCNYDNIELRKAALKDISYDKRTDTYTVSIEL